MEKALEILTGLRQAKSYDENYPTDYEIQEAIEELKAKNESIKELEEAMKPKTCEWEYNEFDEAWDGKCGVKFQIAFYTPKANNMKFCPQCGGKLIEIEPKDNA